MTITAAEQYGIELLNRARLDPLGEVARYGVSLNQGLTPGTITATPKQVLAPHQTLAVSAERHSQWMIDTDTFSHTGAGGTDPGQRMTDAGYVFSGGWSWGENLAYASLTGGRTINNVIGVHHQTLMLSPGHRVNIMRDSFREIGYSQANGDYRGAPGSMVTENFAHRSAYVYVTGVAYSDRDGNDFYSIGEGVSGIRFSVSGASTATAGAGGYAVRASQVSSVTVEIGDGGAIGEVKLNLSAGNVKLDLVSGRLLLTSADTTLMSGVADARLLGISGHSLTGSAADNELEGNRGANRISGLGGDDELIGGSGNDNLSGGSGNDSIKGGVGNDVAKGGTGHDVLIGYTGNDILSGEDGNDIQKGDSGSDVLAGNAGADSLYGGGGNDRLLGGAGADRHAGGDGADDFVFGSGMDSDRIVDFSRAEGDKLVFDNALWSGALTAAQVVARFADVVAGDVVFDFGGGDRVALLDVASLSGLSGAIEII